MQSSATWPGETKRTARVPSRRELMPDREESSVSRPTLKLRDACPRAFHLVWVVVVVLTVWGMCMMLSVSTAAALTLPEADKFLYVRQQGITAIIGLVLMVLLARLNYRKLEPVAVLLLILVGFSLLLIHVPGLSRSAGGATSWIALGPLSFQPSEFAKLAVVLAGAFFLARRRQPTAVSVRARRGQELRSYLWPFGLSALGMCGLVMLEPDLGTAIIIAGLLMGLLWLAGMPGRQWLTLFGLWAAVALLVAVTAGERLSRIMTFLHPSADPQGAGFQVTQSLVALGRGGWLGVGPGQSVQKFSYLPRAHTDMIYAILGEEFGLIGALAIVALFGVFALVCWRLARACADRAGRYLVAGCGMLVVLQAVINIGGVTGAMPLTGVPLPFISYGRNNLLVMFMAVGLILSVARFAPARVTSPVRREHEEPGNVTSLDSWRGYSRARGARAGHR